jgi:phytoene dehydrogenase-like protein
VDANVTFLKLMSAGDLPADFVQAVRHIDYASASCKINIALSELPDFTALPGTAPGPQHRGTIHISPTMEYIERAYDDAKYGYPSKQPIIEATIPSVLDDTLAPPGKYVMSMFTQYFPYKLAPGLQLEEEKEKYADRCFEMMERFAPNFRRAVIHRQVLSPADLERRFGLTGGNIMQGRDVAQQPLLHAPGPGLRRLPHPGPRPLSLRRATHPGGGVMGACGYNAAREIRRDLGR